MKYVIKSQQTVKPFIRTRKGKLERVKGFSREGKAGKTFDYDKMKKLIDSDAFLKKMFNNTPGSDKKIAEVMFNTYVVGDSVMEREYNKKGKVVEPSREILTAKELGYRDEFGKLTSAGKADFNRRLYQMGRDQRRREQEQAEKRRDIGEPFIVGEKVKIWRGEHSGKVGEVVGTDGFDVKVKSGEEVISVPNIQVVNTLDLKMLNEEKWGKDERKKMKKSQEQVKPFTRTRKGKLERVKGFSRIRDMAKYPKATDEAAVHQFAKDHVVSKKKAREYLEEQKQHLKWERTHSGKFGEFGEPYDLAGKKVQVFPMSRRAEGYKAGKADKLLGIRLNISADSPDKDYAEGYRQGNVEGKTLGEPISVREQKDIIRKIRNTPSSSTSAPGEIEEVYEKIQYRSKGSGPDVEGWVVEGKIEGKWYPIEEFGPDEEHKAELKVDELQDNTIGEPISTYGMASLEEDDNETEAVSPEGGTPETERASDEDIAEAVEAKTSINRLVDMSNTIIDDNAVKQMKDALSKLEIHNDWELQDYKDLVEFSEGELRDAKEKGYRSANEYWQAEMPETVTATSSRKIRKGMKLMTIDEVLNLNKSKWQYDFGKEVPIGVMEKAVQVKGFTRTRKGKFERVKPHSREKVLLHREAPNYSDWENAVNHAIHNLGKTQEEAKKWADMKTEFDQAIKAERITAAGAERLYGKKDAGMMRAMHLGDAKDLTKVRNFWMNEDYEGAYNKALDMDTAARDNIPMSVWKDIDKYVKENLGEPYKTTKARPTKRNKLDADLHRRGLVRGDWDVITQKQNEDGSLTLGIKAIEKYKTPSHIEADVFSETVSKPVGDMIRVRINSSGDILEVLGKPVGEPFKFIAEHKKISDKWETNLADKLGVVKDKMQNKQPVSSKELNDLIQETENWRQFKVGEPVSVPGEGYIEAKKNPAGHYQLFYRGTRNEVFPGEKFGSSAEARQYWRSKEKFVDKLEEASEFLDKEKPGEPYSVGERKQIANTILTQMGGAGKLKLMTGAKNFIALESGVSFEFPNRKGPNYMKVTLEPDDTYTVEFGRKRRITDAMATMDPEKPVSMDDFYKKLSEQKDVYWEDLKEIFERETGLYLSLTKSVTSGEKYIVGLEKSKGGFRMARGGAMGEEEKTSKKKEQDETGEKTQAQERLSGYAKRRREEMGPAKNADTDEGGDSEEMAI